MTERKNRSVAIIAEVADALAPYGGIACRPEIAEDAGEWTLHLTFKPQSTEDALRVLELATSLRRVADVAQVRAFADHYGIDPARLEPLVAAMNGDGEEA